MKESTGLTEQGYRRLLTILFAGVLSVALDIALVAAALPAIRDAFGMDARLASWILSGFVLSTLGGMPLMARLSDLYGRGRLFRLNLLMFGLGIVVVLSAPNTQTLIAGRVIQGLGAAGVFPVASAAIGDRVSPGQRGRMLGLLGSVYGIAFIIGPVLGGILVGFGWRWPFVADLVLAVSVVVFSGGGLRDDSDGEKRRLNLPGILLLSMAATAFALGVNRIDTAHAWHSVASVSVWPFLVASVVLGTVFFVNERSTPSPILEPALLLRPQILLVSLFSLGAGVAEATFVFMADFAAEAFTVPHRVASFMLLPLVGAVAIGSPVAGRILDAVGSKTIIATGTVCVAAGMGMLGWLEPTTLTFYVGTIAIGFGLACLLGSALSYILLAEADESRRAMTQGLGTLFISLGQLGGSAAIGAIVASALGVVAGYQGAFRFVAILAVLQVLLTLGLKSRKKETADIQVLTTNDTSS